MVLVVVNSSLKEGIIPLPLKEALVHPFLRKPLLDPTILANFCPMSNSLFGGKVVEKMIVQ